MMNRIKNDAKCDVAGIHRRFSLSFSMTPGDIAGIAEKTPDPDLIRIPIKSAFKKQVNGECRACRSSRLHGSLIGGFSFGQAFFLGCHHLQWMDKNIYHMEKKQHIG